MFFDSGNGNLRAFFVYLLTLTIAPLIIITAACSENKPSSQQSMNSVINANSSETAKKSLTDSTAAAATGKPLYATHCASCHGMDGKGDSDLGYAMSAKPPDLTTGDAVSVSDDEMFLAIKNGKMKDGKVTMPPTKGVTDEQVRQIVSYVRTLAENKKRAE